MQTRILDDGGNLAVRRAALKAAFREIGKVKIAGRIHRGAADRRQIGPGPDFSEKQIR